MSAQDPTQKHCDYGTCDRGSFLAEIKALRAAVGMCPASADGKHSWIVRPVGPDGQPIIMGGTGYGAAAAFCQHCDVPRSRYHE